MRSAHELHQAGLEALVGRRLATARRLLEQARAGATDADLVARIDASRAFLTAEQGDLTEALRLCDEALAQPDLPSGTSGVLHSQRALILVRIGETSSALESFATGIALLEDPIEVAKALTNRGSVFNNDRGEGQRAAADFARAMTLFRDAGHTVGAAMAEHNLGCADLMRGDLVSALAHMDAARPVLLPLSPVGVAITNQDRAEALMAAGLTRSGLAVLDESARTFGNHRLPQRRAEAELTIARASLGSDPQRALAAARSARSRFTRSSSWRVRAEALVLGAEVRLGRTWPSLVRRGDDLAAELDGLELRWWAIDVRLDTALVVLRRGDHDDATDRLKAVRIPARAPLAVRLRDRDVRAALAERSSRPSAALGHLRRGLADLHEWQSSFGSLDLQTMVTGHGRRLAVRGLRVASRSRSPEVLFEWSERARMLASRVQPVRVPHDEQSRGRPRRAAHARGQGGGVAGGRRTPGRAAATGPRARLAGARLRGVRRPDDAWRPSRSGWSGGPWWRTSSRPSASSPWWSPRASATTHDLGPREALDSLLGGLLPGLDMAAAHLPDSFARSVRAEVTTRVARLDDLLLAPLADEIGDRPLVLTPSGALAAVPWTLLPDQPWAGRSSSPSPRRRGPPAPRRRCGPRPAGFVAGPRVPQAEAETTAAAKVWPGSPVLHGAEATADGRQPAGRRCRRPPRLRARSALRRRTRSSRASSSPTGRGSATTSTSSHGCRTSSCSRRARSDARRCAAARS